MQVVVAKSERDPRWLARHHRSNFKCTISKAGISTAVPFSKISATERAEVERLLSNQSQVTAQVRRAFLEAISRLQGQIDLERIRELIAEGRIDQAIAAVNVQLIANGMQPVGQAASAGAVLAGQQAAANLADIGLGHLNIGFGVTNPETINYLRDYEMGLIRGLTRDALASVRLAIANGVSAGRNPLDVARDVRQFIGLTPSQTQAVLNYRAGMENLNRDVLSRGLRDARFDPTIDTAITEQAPLSQDYIDRAVSRYAERYLKYRAETIARTEAIRAVNAGNQQLWRQAAADGKVDPDTVTRSWHYTHDSRTRPAHREIPAMNPDGVGLNEPFDTPLGPLMFPGDPNGAPENTINCRCAVFYRIKYRRPAQDQEVA